MPLAAELELEEPVEPEELEELLLELELLELLLEMLDVLLEEQPESARESVISITSTSASHLTFFFMVLYSFQRVEIM